MKKKIPTIYMEGGLIQGVENFPPGFRFDVVDYDTDGSIEHTCKCHAGKQDDGTIARHYHARRITDENGME